MRTIILACTLALAACGKPAEDKKTERRDPPAPSQPRTPDPAEVTPPAAPAHPLGAAMTAEEKAKEVEKLEAKLILVDQVAAKVTDSMTSVASEAEREQLVKKLEHLAQEKAELRKQLESYGAR